MRKSIDLLFDKFKRRIIIVFQTLLHPGEFIANIIYRVYDYDKDKIPLPLLIFVFKYKGAWAGMGIYLAFRGYDEEIKRSKRQKIVNYFILPLIIALIILLGGIQKGDHFFFGFAQNLLADIILILLVIYILPQILNKPNTYKVSLESKYSNQTEEQTELILSIKNIGKVVFKKEEIYWEIFIPSDDLLEGDIIHNEGIVEAENYDIPFSMWKFSGINNKPLFIDHELIITRLLFRSGLLLGTETSPYKIYYRFRTIGGNFPTLEKVTADFLGTGISVEKYPKVGEYVFKELYNPADIFKKDN